jgi:predicted nucleotidyltransferase
MMNDEKKSVARSGTFSAIAEEFGVELIVAFGSRIKGRGRPESDWDLAVLRRRGRPRWTLDDLCELEYRLWDVLRPKGEIDLVDLTDASPLLLGEVADHGRPLHAASPVSFALFRSWAMRRYEDNEKWFRRREASLRRRLHVA